MKIIIFGIASLAFAIVAALLFVSGRQKEATISQLMAEKNELAAAQASVAAQPKADSDLPELSKKEREELLRLRNEVGLLRRERQQLKGEVDQAQKVAERIAGEREAQVQNLRQQQQAAESAAGQVAGAAIACVRNLRQLDGAKQQWALENRQPAEAVALAEHIAPYLRNQTIPPCPANGVYTLNQVGAQVTCSIPGHVAKANP